MSGTAATRGRLLITRSALAGCLLALLVTGCTTPTPATSTTPAESDSAVAEQPSGSVSPDRSGSVDGPSSNGGAAAPSAMPTASSGPATAADIERVVEKMLDGGSRYETLIQAFLVQVNGETVVARYHPDSGPGITNDVYSVTKSVMSLLIGIAIDEGSIASVEQTLAELLPQHVGVMAPGVGEMTLEQVLTMSGGLVGDDDPEWLRPYDQPDWVAAILATPLLQPPGTSFAYSSMGSHLLSAILVTATGRSVLDYAREKVFGPLGIVSEPAAQPVSASADWTLLYDATPGFAWSVDPQGLNLGFADLKITAPDMIKIGQLYLDGGVWDGMQIVSAQWVARSTSAVVDTGFSSGTGGYGYQWWVSAAGGHDVFAAMGYAGQLIEVIPELDLVVAVASLDAPASFDASSFAQLVHANLVPLLDR
jgi:CubicO group peptidase (beta-lactamase class C family)